jgi:hypothetical protein
MICLLLRLIYCIINFAISKVINLDQNDASISSCIEGNAEIIACILFDNISTLFIRAYCKIKGRTLVRYGDHIRFVRRYDGSSYKLMLNSFLLAREEKVSEAFKEYDGQLFVKKLTRLNSMLSHTPETNSFVFKLKRRKLHIDILRLGPEESR